MESSSELIFLCFVVNWWITSGQLTNNFVKLVPGVHYTFSHKVVFKFFYHKCLIVRAWDYTHKWMTHKSNNCGRLKLVLKQQMLAQLQLFASCYAQSSILHIFWLSLCFFHPYFWAFSVKRRDTYLHHWVPVSVCVSFQGRWSQWSMCLCPSLLAQSPFQSRKQLNMRQKNPKNFSVCSVSFWHDFHSWFKIRAK